MTSWTFQDWKNAVDDQIKEIHQEESLYYLFDSSKAPGDPELVDAYWTRYLEKSVAAAIGVVGSAPNQVQMAMGKYKLGIRQVTEEIVADYHQIKEWKAQGIMGKAPKFVMKGMMISENTLLFNGMPTEVAGSATYYNYINDPGENANGVGSRPLIKYHATSGAHTDYDAFLADLNQLASLMRATDGNPASSYVFIPEIAEDLTTAIQTKGDHKEKWSQYNELLTVFAGVVFVPDRLMLNMNGFTAPTVTPTAALYDWMAMDMSKVEIKEGIPLKTESLSSDWHKKWKSQLIESFGLEFEPWFVDESGTVKCYKSVVKVTAIVQS